MANSPGPRRGLTGRTQASCPWAQSSFHVTLRPKLPAQAGAAVQSPKRGRTGRVRAVQRLNEGSHQLTKYIEKESTWGRGRSQRVSRSEREVPCPTGSGQQQADGGRLGA